MNQLHPSATRVAAAGRTLGLDLDVVEIPSGTRTAADAATACGCSPAQIVKSLVFRTVASRQPVLLLVAGDNRVDESHVGGLLGDRIERPDADYVRTVTGFAIGGIPPFGHATPLATYCDADLLQHDVVWAAAGTPHAVFSVNPRALADALGARVIVVG